MGIDSTKIAHNTLFLYVRLILVMFVSLYTSRVVLEILGATDYGFYYAIFSVIGLLSFLNGTLSIGTSRFIAFEIGKKNTVQLEKTFDTTFYSHIFLAGIIIILGETVGLWYVENHLVIPPGREYAAFWVYQISIISSAIAIIQVPYTAEIMAHEKMNAYAYIGIYEAVGKLAIVFLLVRSDFDKLIYFAVLQAIVGFTVLAFYIIYCSRNFKEVSLRLQFDKSIFNSIIRFSGWNIIANISETLMSQGVIMLYNLFFMPAVVAAQAISNQISHVISQFVGNVRQAVNPQVIKLYANEQYRSSQKLTFLSTEYIFYLLLLLGVPCIIAMPRILSVWLVEVPEYTVAFSRLIIVQMILGNFSSAFYIPMMAANKVEKNSIASVFLCILQFALLWLLFHFGFGPLWARYLGIFSVVMFSFVVKPYILYKDVNYNLEDIYRVVGKCTLVMLIITVLCCGLYYLIPQNNLLMSIIVSVISVIIVVGVAFVSIGKSQFLAVIDVVRKR